VRFFGALFVARDFRRRAHCSPFLVMLLDDLGLGLRGSKQCPLILGKRTREAVLFLRLVDRTRHLLEPEIRRKAPSGAAREIRGTELTAFEALALDASSRAHRSIELLLRMRLSLDVGARRFGLAERIGQRDFSLIDFVGTNALERIERILSRHGALIIAHAGAMDKRTRGLELRSVVPFLEASDIDVAVLPVGLQGLHHRQRG